MKRVSDESGVIISWLLRVLLVLAVISVVGFDFGSSVVNNVTLASTAEDVAIAVSIEVDQGVGGLFPPTRIYDMAVAELEAEGHENIKVIRNGTEIDAEGIVHIRLRRRAETLVADLIGPLKRFTIATVSGQAGTN